MKMHLSALLLQGAQCQWLRRLHLTSLLCVWGLHLPDCSQLRTELLWDAAVCWWEDFRWRTPCQPCWNGLKTGLPSKTLLLSSSHPPFLPSLSPSEGQRVLPLFHLSPRVTLLASLPINLTLCPLLRHLWPTPVLHTKENWSRSIFHKQSHSKVPG